MHSAAGTDWRAWHQAYDDPGSVVSRRLNIVRALLAEALDQAPPGPVRILSVCAGDGRDVLGVLDHHDRTADVEALLVDLDESLVADARAGAAKLGLDRVACEAGDAGLARWYEASSPWSVLLACGVFGNIAAADVRRTIDAASVVVARGGSVIWTRHRRPPDQTPAIRGWFEEYGFEESAFVAVPDSRASVGCHRLARSGGGTPLPVRLFTFVGDGSGAHV